MEILNPSVMRSLELALNIKANLEDYLNYEHTTHDINNTSFEQVLKNIFNSGEYLCDKCMDTINTYIDVDKLLDNCSADKEHLYPTKQKQRTSHTSSNTNIHLSSLPSMFFGGVIDRKNRLSRNTSERDTISKPSTTSGLNTPQQPFHVEQSASVPPPQPIIQQVDIMSNDKYLKLVQLLESNIATLTNPPKVKEPEPVVIMAPPQPTPPAQETHPLTEHILAERVRELSEDLRISQEDLKEHQYTIKKLLERFRKTNDQLATAKTEMARLSRALSAAEITRTELAREKNRFYKMAQRVEKIKKEVLRYSETTAKDIETDYVTQTNLQSQNKMLKEQIDGIYSFYKDVSWDEVAKGLDLENPDNFFGKLVLTYR